MKIKKILSGLLAAALAFGAMAVLPTSFADISVTASAETTKDGFVLDVDDDGDYYVSGYTGKGGAITIPKEAAYVGYQAFYGNDNITSVTIPSTCWYAIGEDAFLGCSKLKKVTFEGDIQLVCTYCFAFCDALETVTFKGDVYTDAYSDTNGGIGAYAFFFCPKLKKVDFTDHQAKVGAIGKAAFWNCFSLSTVNLPENLFTLYNGVFLNCFELTTLTVPEKTEFVYSEGAGCQYGYVCGYRTENGAVNDPYQENAEFIKADGKTAVWVDTDFGDDVKAEKFIPKAGKMIVTKGSDAEAYAKKYGIKYEYAKLAAPAGFKASKTTSSVTLTWGAVSGADAYRVYIYDSETGKYEKYKNVTSTKCTVTDLKSGTKYKFKVVALAKADGKYKAGTTSKAVSVTTK